MAKVPSIKDQTSTPEYWLGVMALPIKIWRGVWPGQVEHGGQSPVLDPLFTTFTLVLPDDLSAEEVKARLLEECVPEIAQLGLEKEFEAWMGKFIQAYFEVVS